MNKKNIILVSLLLLIMIFIPDFAAAGSGGTVSFTDPLGFSTVEAFLAKFLSYIQGIIVTISLIFIVIGGLLYITSAGDEGRMKTAKGAILASMIGLAIGVAAPSLLREIADILDWGGASDPAVDAALTLSEIAMNTLNFLLSIVGILAMLMLIVGGIMYITSAGDEKKTDTAKGLITYAIVGLIVSLLSLVIVKQIALLFA